MATLVLGVVGSALGAGFGGTILGLSGAVIGGFVGSTIGSVVDTVVNIGSTVAGAGGQLVVNSPTVQFGSSVLAISAPQANVSAARMGLGGATADATNRLSVNSPATLLNHAGAGHEATINKNAAANDAALAFKTGFSTRALIGLLGSDDFSFKVSPDGTAFFDAFTLDRTNGRPRFPVGLQLQGLASDPASPPDGLIWHNVTEGTIRAQVAGRETLLGGDPVPFLLPASGQVIMTTGASGGGATTTFAGVAGQLNLFPWACPADFTIDALQCNVTTAVAGAQGKIACYSSDATGRADALLFESATVLDFATVGVKTALQAFTFIRGRVYWFGLRHSATATVSAWALTATPDVNGGTPVTTARKTLRRNIAFASAPPASWVFNAAEIAAGPGSAIWLRRA